MNKDVELASVPREALVLALALALGVVALQALVLAFRGWRRRRRLALRMERAADGESRAAEWLTSRGYRILGAQVAIDHGVCIDERLVLVGLRADYLVERHGRRYVVEVKTGAHAPRLETSATRRQMLEYRVAFDVDGVILVDGETGGIHEVTFPSLGKLAPRSSGGWGIAAVAALVLGLATALALAH